MGRLKRERIKVSSRRPPRGGNTFRVSHAHTIEQSSAHVIELQQEAHWQDVFDCSFGFRTEFRQPQRHAAVDLVEDQDDHQVDDDRRRRHRYADVGFGLRVGAHRHQGRHCDAVDDDAKDCWKGQAKLKTEQGK